MQTATPFHAADSTGRPGRRAFLAGAGAAAMLYASGAAAAGTAPAAAFPFTRSRAVAMPAGHPWMALCRRHRRQNLEARLAATGADAWATLVRRLARLPQTEGGTVLHHALQRIAYRSDDRVYRRSDAWATPREFVALGGDCEDFAVAAWLALAECGVPTADLRIIVGGLPDTGAAHAVTALRSGNGVTLFDILADEPVHIRRFDRLRPFYSLSEDRLWLHVGDDTGALTTP